METIEESSQILFLSTYPPRECGIATFCQDVSKAVSKRYSPNIKTKVAAMNRNAVNIYNYPKKVILEIDDADINSYIKAAKKINKLNKIKAVSVQHEFGIFGGDYGSYLIAFLESLEKPCVLTFHSVLPDPDPALKKVVLALAEKSSAFMVMTKKARKILREDYGLINNIYVVHHGVPTVEFESSSIEKKKLNLKNNIVLTSFGLISPGKGYEFVIDALPEVVKKHPNLLYLIVGETHPVVRKNEGEKYRNELEQKVKELGLSKNVKFYNKYLALKEILQYLKASDIYISASLNPNQASSGTLVYALSCGRPVISTPFIHAAEAVTEDRGRLTKFNDSKSFESALLELLDDPKLLRKMGKRAFEYTRQMTWPNVAILYERIFAKHSEISSPSEPILPELKMDHLLNMTDNFGIIQFANSTKPDIKSGYTTDDNVRAMLACCMEYNKSKELSKLDLIKTYLNYLDHVQQPDGRFMNYVDYEKNTDLKRWTADAHGRTLWCLGVVASQKNLPGDISNSAKALFEKGLEVIDEFSSPRALAFSLIGLYHFNLRVPSGENLNRITKIADFLESLYNQNATKSWIWFEQILAYSNSKLPEAMLYAYLATKRKKYKTIGLSTLTFLISITFEKNMFIPVGQKGWFRQNGTRAYYDQQPVDTASMVQTLMLAHKITDKEVYKKRALRTFEWFLGKNMLKQMVYNTETGGCFDGLGKSSININQGAESTISYLIARLSL